MGTSQGFDALAVKLGALATALDASKWFLDTHRAIGRAAKVDAARHGGTMHPWSKGKAASRAVKLAAWDRSTADSMQLRPRQPGLWAIREDGAKGHREPKGFTKTGKARKARKVLTIPGSKSGFARSASHPGAPAQHRWTAVGVDVQREAPGIVDDQVRATLASTFGAGG